MVTILVQNYLGPKSIKLGLSMLWACMDANMHANRRSHAVLCTTVIGQPSLRIHVTLLYVCMYIIIYICIYVHAYLY